MESTAPSSHYRREVDGLRAIAVLSVVIFHIQPDALPGGFVGVDIFFVISGYLISQKIIAGLHNQTFSFSSFYIGRIRRLYPSYITVIAASTAAAWLLLTPQALEYYGTSLKSSLYYLSNINFASESGYFDLDSEMKPLLHTWSLSVEEQFYLAFPVVVLLIIKNNLNLKLTITTLITLSFVANISLVHTSPSNTFYFLPTRAWELGVGALLSLGAFPNKASLPKQQSIFFAGIFLIPVSLTFINASTPYPGFWALLPVLSTYLIIGSSQNLNTNPLLRIIQSKPLVFIGVISYAFYLWHWPIIVFYKLYFDQSQLNLSDSAIILFLSLILAWISTHIIEPPIRKGKISNQNTIILIIIFTLLFTLLAIHIKHSDGAHYRYSQGKIYKQTKETNSKLRKNDSWRSCQPLLKIDIDEAQCREYGTEGDISLAIWGDSHSRSLAKAIELSNDSHFIVLTTDGCPPVANVRRADNLGNANNCTQERNNQILDSLTELAPKKILLISRWSIYHHGWIKAGELQDETHYLCDFNCKEEASPETSFRVLEKNLTKTAKKLATKSEVTIIKGTPVLSKRGEEIFFYNDTYKKRYIPDSNKHNETQGEINKMIDRISKNGNVRAFDPATYLCEHELCRIADSNYLFYIDDNHLTPQGWLSMEKPLKSIVTPKTSASP